MMNAFKQSVPAIAAALLIALAGTVMAGDDSSGHDAHVHGIATLNLAVDGSALLIELDSPAANIIGFEHPPRTEEERQAANWGQALMVDAERLFVPSPEAECALVRADVSLDLGDDGAGDRSDADVALHGREAHADAHGEYAFECARPERLTRLDVRVFETLRGIEQLRVQVITAGGQYGVSLTPEDHLLSL